VRATGPSAFPTRFAVPLAVGLAVATALTLPAPRAAHGESPATRPNIVVIMTDDQTVAELSGMPKTLRLIGDQGVRFRRSYVSYPVCCPSRATYLTGQYAHNHRVMGLYPPTGGYGRFDKRNALPVWLRRTGYYTSHLGKFLNGYGDQEAADVPPGWSDWHATVDYSTYRMWGYAMNDNGRFHTYGSPFDEDPRMYQTDVLAGKALSVIRSRAGRQPFFLSVNFLAPHYEDRRIQRRTGQLVRPAPRHQRAFASAQLPRTASFDERDMSDKPRFLQRRAPRLTAADIARLTRDARSRRAALLAVDDAVARIVTALRRRGELDNTYIVFTSDNGYMQGEHRVRSGKMLPYEPSAAVPLLIRGPGLPAGRVSSELVANIDLAPTLLDIADAEPGKTVDGRSLLPFARHPDWRTRRTVLHETGGRKSTTLRGQDEASNSGHSLKRVMTYRAVRTPGWLYVRYHGGDSELYNLKRDPNEMRSLHDDPRYRPVRRALARELRRLAHCQGQACRRSIPRIPRSR
jgi:N-acetylglucosamine-6-sulfatase